MREREREREMGGSVNTMKTKDDAEGLTMADMTGMNEALCVVREQILVREHIL